MSENFISRSEYSGKAGQLYRSYTESLRWLHGYYPSMKLLLKPYSTYRKECPLVLPDSSAGLTSTYLHRKENSITGSIVSSYAENTIVLPASVGLLLSENDIYLGYNFVMNADDHDVSYPPQVIEALCMSQHMGMPYTMFSFANINSGLGWYHLLEQDNGETISLPLIQKETLHFFNDTFLYFADIQELPVISHAWEDILPDYEGHDTFQRHYLN